MRNEPERNENLRDAARGSIETLEKAYEILRIVCGEKPLEAREDIASDVTINQLDTLLTDIRYLADRLVVSAGEINRKI